MSYIETTARYQKTAEDGKVKNVSEKYLVDALSNTEAIATTVERLTPYVSGELNVSASKTTKIAEVFIAEDADKFYLAKVAFITIDEKTAKEKRTISQWLVGGTDFNDAYETVLREFNTITTCDPELISLAESPIVEFYPAKLCARIRDNGFSTKDSNGRIEDNDSRQLRGKLGGDGDNR